MEKYCFLNGRTVSLKNAKIPIDDIGVLRAYGVFDFLRTYHGRLFLFREHWQRFCRSAKTLGVKIPTSEAQTKKIVYDLMKKNELSDATARLVLTGGSSRDGMHFGDSQPNFFILLGKIPPRKEKDYINGVELLPVEHQREFPIAKSNSYLTSIKFKNFPHSDKILDLLYCDDGKILEGSTCNFFLIKGNNLITAKDGILSGVTRNFVIKLAKKKMKVKEREVLFEELKQADETFITTTTKEILPVVKVGKVKVGSGKVGEKTKMLMGLFREAVG